jgi:foldase protein PrsA
LQDAKKNSRGNEMKKKAVSVLFVLIFVGIAAGVQAAGRVVAMVGNARIAAADLKEALARYVPPGSLHASMDPAKKEKYRKAALNELIELELLYDEAKSRGIKVPKDLFDKVLAENVKGFGSKEKFEEVLKMKGMTMDDFREKVVKYRMAYQLLGQLAKESECSDGELRAYYEKNRSQFKRPESMHLWHILIKVEPTASAAEVAKKKKEAEEVLKRLKAGEDFYDVAYKYSEDNYRVKGGDLGFIHRGQLDPQELDNAAFSLKKGRTSGLIRTIYGFHILRAGEKKPAKLLSFDEAKGKLRKELTEKRFKEKKEALIRRLKAEYPVTILAGEKKKGDTTGREGMGK